MADDWQPQSKYGNMSYGEKLEINFSPFLRNILLVLLAAGGLLQVFPCREQNLLVIPLSPGREGEIVFSYFLASLWFFQSLRFVKAAEPSGKRHPS